MKKTIVVYGSKYGSTKEYASLIAEELGCNCMSYYQVNANLLQNYEVIIYGGGLYAGKMRGLNKFKKYISKLKDKKIIMFAVGAASEQADTLDRIKKQNEIISYPVFYLRGGMDVANMTKIDRFMIKMLKKSAEKKTDAEQTTEMKKILEMYDKKVSFVDKKNIRPLMLMIKKQG